MVKLSFKEVGQGDSIIIEWADEGKEYIGLIDCNLKPNNINPSLNYLESSNYSVIEFIILSHPHDDHFSGLNQILTFCENNSIIIKKFYHSCASVPEYLKTAVLSYVSLKELGILFTSVKRLKSKGLIFKAPLITDTTKEIDLADGFKLDFLSPSDSEYDLYNRIMYKEKTGLKNNNPDANSLSTVITIYNSIYSVLLTSDAVIPVLKRLGIKDAERLGNNIYLAQVPHHGAKGNYYHEFWKKRRFPAGMPAIISVGENRYHHPSLEVVKSLQSLGARIFSTNPINNCRILDAAERSAYLDWISGVSEPINNYLTSSSLGDVVCFLNEHSISI